MYIPGLARNFDGLGDLLDEADCVFLDATFWSEDELIEHGLGRARACDMAHWPLDGHAGSLAFLNMHQRDGRFLTHVNNTNPILDEDSPQRAELARRGIEVAFDGMEIAL